MTGKKILTVSVIIPTYNRSHLVGRAIQSVLDQTFQDFEIIVVDDGSTDNTKEVLDSCYRDKIRYFYQSRSAPSVARNRGFFLSHGEYIHFLDSDDYFLPNNIEEKVNILEQEPDLGWVFSDCYYTYSKSRNKAIERLKKHLLDRTEVFDLLLMNYFVNTDTVMMRKECFEQTGGFDENLESFEDMDFFYRLASLYKAALVDKPLVVINAQEDNITNDRKKFYKGRIAVIEKVKKLFPEKTKELGFPGRRSEADILNFIGSEHLNANQKKMAFKVFLKSIRTIPFQKRVYLLILTTLFQIVNRRPPVTDESKKESE